MMRKGKKTMCRDEMAEETGVKIFLWSFLGTSSKFAWLLLSHSGYRHVQLYSLSGSRIQSATLFVHIRTSKQPRSISRKKSFGPQSITQQKEANPNKVKIGIPELDEAYLRAPRAEIEDVLEELLRGVERLKHILEVDSFAPFEQMFAQLKRLAEQAGGSLINEVRRKKLFLLFFSTRCRRFFVGVARLTCGTLLLTFCRPAQWSM